MVYLIHLESKLKHSQHYIGFVEGKLDARVERHRKGLGAKFLRAANLAGINWHVVRVWDDEEATRDFERKLKNRKNSKCMCPDCTPKQKEHRYKVRKKRQKVSTNKNVPQ